MTDPETATLQELDFKLKVVLDELDEVLQEFAAMGVARHFQVMTLGGRPACYKCNKNLMVDRFRLEIV